MKKLTLDISTIFFFLLASIHSPLAAMRMQATKYKSFVLEEKVYLDAVLALVMENQNQNSSDSPRVKETECARVPQPDLVTVRYNSNPVAVAASLSNNFSLAYISPTTDNRRDDARQERRRDSFLRMHEDKFSQTTQMTADLDLTLETLINSSAPPAEILALAQQLTDEQLALKYKIIDSHLPTNLAWELEERVVSLREDTSSFEQLSVEAQKILDVKHREITQRKRDASTIYQEYEERDKVLPDRMTGNQGDLFLKYAEKIRSSQRLALDVESESPGVTQKIVEHAAEITYRKISAKAYETVASPQDESHYIEFEKRMRQHTETPEFKALLSKKGTSDFELMNKKLKSCLRKQELCAQVGISADLLLSMAQTLGIDQQHVTASYARQRQNIVHLEGLQLLSTIANDTHLQAIKPLLGAYLDIAFTMNTASMSEEARTLMENIRSLCQIANNAHHTGHNQAFNPRSFALESNNAPTATSQLNQMEPLIGILKELGPEPSYVYALHAAGIDIFKNAETFKTPAQWDIFKNILLSYKQAISNDTKLEPFLAEGLGHFAKAALESNKHENAQQAQTTSTIFKQLCDCLKGMCTEVGNQAAPVATAALTARESRKMIAELHARRSLGLSSSTGQGRFRLGGRGALVALFLGQLAMAVPRLIQDSKQLLTAVNQGDYFTMGQLATKMAAEGSFVAASCVRGLQCFLRGFNSTPLAKMQQPWQPKLTKNPKTGVITFQGKTIKHAEIGAFKATHVRSGNHVRRGIDEWASAQAANASAKAQEIANAKAQEIIVKCSKAAMLADKKGLLKMGDNQIPVIINGKKGVVSCHITKTGKVLSGNAYRGQITNSRGNIVTETINLDEQPVDCIVS